MQKHVNLEDLVKSFPTNIYLQNSASIQKRTSPVKFAHLAEKSGKGSISNLSTKVGADFGPDPVFQSLAKAAVDRGCGADPATAWRSRLAADLLRSDPPPPGDVESVRQHLDGCAKAEVKRFSKSNEH